MQQPAIKKLGTLSCDLVEATPVVYNNRLYRFEYVRSRYKYNTTGDSYFRFVDVESDEPTPAFAHGYHLGSAHVEGDTIYAYGVKLWGESSIQVFWSKDFRNWEAKTSLDMPGFGIYNNSVCKCQDGYRMAIELGEPLEEVGERFTMRFAESCNLIDWKLMPSECIFSKDRYTACPALRFLDDYYYMIYLEETIEPVSEINPWGYSYVPHIVRSKDFTYWESSPYNPIITFDDEDRKIANPKLNAEERQRIATAVDVNNSDVDLCEFQGKTIINYSWGDQHRTEHLAEAIYEGSMADFLRGYFPGE